MIACSLVLSPEHHYFDHPESPDRFRDFIRLKETGFSSQLAWLDAQPARLDEIARAHQPEMIAFLQRTAGRPARIIDPAPTYGTPASWEAALLAAGGTLACTRAVQRGEFQAGFALVRPPGHHAEPDRSMGFCLLNNLAIAALAALEDPALRTERVLIVDFDAHHGNGTQQIFRGDPRVAFISTHQAGIYPPGYGGLRDIPEAAGRMVNLPLPAYSGDTILARIFEEVIRPLARRFKPGIILVSAGYDGHWDDPLTNLGISTRGYYQLSRRLVDLAGEMCGGKIVFVLEGGYEPASLADNCLAGLAALCGADLPGDPAGPSPYPEAEIDGLLHTVKVLHGLE